MFSVLGFDLDQMDPSQSAFLAKASGDRGRVRIAVV